MIECNPVPVLQKYGTSATYIDPIDAECIRAGVVPLDSLPASWWNWLWNESTGALIEANRALTSVICELDNVICAAGITPREACMNQLHGAINCLRQTLATAQTAGSVVSSSDNGKVTVNEDGTMTVNGLGNVTNLTTSAKTNVVAAINELKSTYDSCTSTLDSCITTLDNTKAPNNHASSATTYGLGNASNYGHLKLSDTYDSEVEGDGIAASQKALYCVYAAMSATGVQLGNTVGCALGTASAGSAGTAARSDHVHPAPSLVTCSCCLVDNTGKATIFCWSGYNGNPSWVWGSSVQGTTCVYNPRCFTVKCADSATTAGSATTAANATNATNASCANVACYAFCHYFYNSDICQLCTGSCASGCYCNDIYICFPSAGWWMILTPPEIRICSPTCACCCWMQLATYPTTVNCSGCYLQFKCYDAGWQKIGWAATKNCRNSSGCTWARIAKFY